MTISTTLAVDPDRRTSRWATCHPITYCVLTAIAALVTGCGESRALDTAGLVHDSAGITIVTVGAAELAVADTWVIDSIPAVRIGIGGTPEQELASVTSAVRLDNGEIAIANAATSEVRFYSSKGEFIRSAGRSGEGPGEYRFILRLCVLDDGLGIWDEGLKRLTLVARDGEVVRTHNLATEGGVALTVRVCADGSRVLIGPEDRYKFRDLNVVRRDSLPLIAFDTRSGATDTIGVYPGEEQYELNVPPVVLVERAPFGSSTGFAARDGRLLVADNSRSEIAVVDQEGALVSLLRPGFAAPEVTAADKARFRDANIDESWRPTYLAAKRVFIDEVPFPPRMPWYGSVMTDGMGRVWVAGYVPPHLVHEQALRWTIIDSRDGAVATMMTPPGFNITQVGNGWVLGVARDEYDVEQVQMVTYRPLRQAGRPIATCIPHACNMRCDAS